MDLYEEPVNMAALQHQPTYENNPTRPRPVSGPGRSGPNPRPNKAPRRREEENLSTSQINANPRPKQKPNGKTKMILFVCAFLVLLILIIVCLALVVQINGERTTPSKGTGQFGEVEKLPLFMDKMLNKTRRFLDFLIANANVSTNATISAKEEDLNSVVTTMLNESLQRSNALVKALCPLYRLEKCFIPVTDVKRNLTDASSECRSRGAKLANIYSQAHMDAMMGYIRNNTLGSNRYLDFHLGMKSTPSGGKDGAPDVKLSDGRVAPYLRWDEKYPMQLESGTALLLRVNKDPISKDQYLWDFLPTALSYAICEI